PISGLIAIQEPIKAEHGRVVLGVSSTGYEHKLMKTFSSLLSVLALYCGTLDAYSYVLSLPPGITMCANHFNHVPNNRLINFLAPVPDGSVVYIWDKNIQAFKDTYEYIDGFGWFSSSDPNPDGPIVNPGD